MGIINTNVKAGEFKQLIQDGKKNKVLEKKINLKIRVTMFHGSKDEVVPVSFSKKALQMKRLIW